MRSSYKCTKFYFILITRRGIFLIKHAISSLKACVPKYKLFVPCGKFESVKKFLVVLLLPILFACNDDSNEFRDLLPDIPVNKTIFLNNPEFIDLQIVGGWAYTSGGISGIIIYHSGINTYLAYERSAPHLSPQACSQMVVKNSLTMECACDDSVFNILNGAPMTEGVRYSARQYRVLNTGPSTLQITNF